MSERTPAQIELLYRLSEAAARAGDLDTVLETSLDGLQEALGVDRSSLLLFDEAGVMRFRAWRGLSERYRQAVEGHTPWQPGHVDPQPIVVGDVLADDDLAPYRDLFTAEDIRALTFVPLVAEGRLIGKFMLYHRRPGGVADDDLQMAQILGRQMAAAIDRKRTEAALRDSEAELRAIFEAGGSGKALAELPSGRFVRVNAELCRLTGYSEAELLGKTFGALTAPEDREATRTSIERLIGGEIPVHQLEKRYLRADGERVWVQVTASIVRRVAGGEPALAAGVVMDISARKRAEEALRRSEEHWRILAKTGAALAAAVEVEQALAALSRSVIPLVADYAVVHLAEDGRLRQAAAAHHDPEGEEVLRRLGAVYDPGRNPESRVRRVVESGRPELVADVLPLLEQAAGEIPPEVAAALAQLSPRSLIIVPLAAGGEVLGALSVLTDGRRPFYTERDLPLCEELGRRAGLALANARLYEELRRRDRRKDEFLAQLAHELRNPLAATVSALELVHRGDPGGRGLEIARRQTRQMSRLIDDLLEVSRITRGKIDLRPEPVELGGLVRRAVETAGAMAGGRLRHRLTVAGAGEPMWVDGDPPRLEQVISNLLTNAVKYTPPGGAIEVSVAAGDGEAKVSVRDTGIGIDADLLPRIFELFVQGAPRAGEAGGLGIGLTLARLLVELHSGRLEAASEGSGRGSTFTLALPQRAAPQARADERTSAAEEMGAHRGSGRVLLVEDNADSAEVMERLLREWGYQVTVAPDPPAALDLAGRTGGDEGAPQVVLMDIGLPGMDGWELAGRLRRHAGIADAVFIALTGFGQQADRDRSAAAGFRHHLVKPVEPGYLRELLAGALDG